MRLRRSIEHVCARSAVRKRRPEAFDLASALDFVYGFRFGEAALVPIQIRSELEAFLGRVQMLQPKCVLEIGTASGGTLFLLAHVAPDDALIFSIDQLNGPARRHLLRGFARRRQRVVPIRADSHDPRTVDRVRAVLGEEQLDLLFVDGDHSYEGVRHDFDLYEPLVRQGGLIAFHDIVPGPRAGDVWRFWGELKSSYEAEEFVAAPEQEEFGIGVVEVPSRT